jgi:hypothetical protein
VEKAHFLVHEDEWNRLRAKMPRMSLDDGMDHSGGPHGCIIDYDCSYMMNDDCILDEVEEDDSEWENYKDEEDDYILQHLRDLESTLDYEEAHEQRM